MEIEIGGKKIEFQITDLAERASGGVMVRCGDTQVLTTCVMGQQEIKGLGFLPLSVNYEERYYAAGKILGPRYIKREGKPSDNAVTISRSIDRTIRPLFEKGLQKEVQVIITCLSWDEENEPDILGVLGASLSLLISNIPWQGPVGAVRIGTRGGKLILNPTYQDQEESSLDIVFAGVKKDGKILINMIEAGCKEANEDLILEAVKLAKPEIKKLIEAQEKINKEVGKEKIVVEKEKEPELEEKIKNFLGQKIEKVLFPSSASASAKATVDKKAMEGKGKDLKEEGLKRAEKLNELKRELIEFIEKDFPEKEAFVKEFFEEEVEKLVHQNILEKERRIDGRKLEEIRKVHCKVGLIPRTHGSGLFCRGLTKSLSILTLGGPGEQQLIEGMEIVAKKRFLHHYNFPPYSVGEVRRLAAPSRREIGHGMLVEKALFSIIPDLNDFPYTIRVVSEILSSNGSTSMAAICSSCLALMDAGVPVKGPVAGIAIGLMRGKENYKLLTDIQGPEDFHGDMDLKVAGTRKGITVLQMDVKTSGIEENILKEALLRGRKARLEILDLMEKVIQKPRAKLSPFAPKIYMLKIPIEKIGEVIGPKGHTIKRIVEQTEATIDIEPTGTVFITSKDEDSAKKALGIIKNITREIRMGETFLGKVKKILNFGAFLELGFGQEGLLHASQIKKPLKVGEKLLVKVVSIDESGRINLGLGKPAKRYAKRRKN